MQIKYISAPCCISWLKFFQFDMDPLWAYLHYFSLSGVQDCVCSKKPLMIRAISRTRYCFSQHDFLPKFENKFPNLKTRLEKTQGWVLNSYLGLWSCPSMSLCTFLKWVLQPFFEFLVVFFQWVFWSYYELSVGFCPNGFFGSVMNSYCIFSKWVFWSIMDSYFVFSKWVLWPSPMMKPYCVFFQIGFFLVK